MGILQALFGSGMEQQGMQSGFTPVNQMPQNQVQQAPQTLGLVQDILSQRFQPQAQDVAQSIFANGTGLGTNGGITTPEAQSVQRLAPVMDIAKTLGTLNQSQLEIAKLNEQMRHDRATEGQALNNNTLSVGPPRLNQPSMNIPTQIQNNAPQSSNTSNISDQMQANASPVNNPGNLRPVGASSGFQQFASPQAGSDAMTADLTAKVTGNSPAMVARYGPNYQPTLRNVITTYAPPSDNNDTEGYINTVSKLTGIHPDAPLSAQDVQTIQPAMTQVEQGTTLQVNRLDNAAYVAGSQAQTSPQGQGFMPVFKGSDVMKDGLSPDFAYVPNPAGGIKAQQIPGTIVKGANGEILHQDPQTGEVTQTLPKNPQAQAKFESNIQKIAGLFDQLHKMGGSIEAGGSAVDNKINQLKGTSGIEIEGVPLLPGGQSIMQGTQTQAIRDEIQGLIKQTTPLYMQAMGITPGMERAQAAQQMLQDALGGSVMKSRQANQYSLSNLSQQAGTGQYNARFNTIKAAQDAIVKGAPKDAVAQRLKAAGLDPADIE